MAINWDQTLGDVASTLGTKLLSAAKESAGDAWDDIEDVNKEQIETLAILLGQLKIRELQGEDISDLTAHIEAQMSNLSFVNESIGVRAVQAFWKQAAEISMSVIFNVAGKFIGL